MTTTNQDDDLITVQFSPGEIDDLIMAISVGKTMFGIPNEMLLRFSKLSTKITDAMYEKEGAVPIDFGTRKSRINNEAE